MMMTMMTMKMTTMMMMMVIMIMLLLMMNMITIRILRSSLFCNIHQRLGRLLRCEILELEIRRFLANME